MNTRLAVAIALLCSAPAALAQSDAEFLPMKAGARYEYQGKMGKFTVEVLTATEDEARTREVQKTGNSVIGDLVGDALYRQGNDGVTAFRAITSPLGRNEKMEAVLRFPLKVGSKWKDDENVVYKVGARGVTVKVPAGEFKNCVRIDIYYRGKKMDASRWYAPGVGLVKDGMRGDLVKVSGIGT
ncbi:hypothetical protein [Anaeromyxobacter sp. SG66]|uniref:hypothetical protein n=1 Tax=Anaeromyxobacter sp. SG66 TaxID=2925410 RepID=UPI001F57D35A|nr:hypothetical protein [Anaeromyxobacter sp. SG66]